MFEALAKRARAWAERSGRGYPDWALRYVPAVRRLKPRPSQRVLEIGANENGLARFAPVRPIVADRSRAHCEAARRAQNVLPVVADIAALPFPDACFEVVVCMDVFEHLSGVVRGPAAHAVCRVLAPDGRVAVTFPSGRAALEAEARVRGAYAGFTGRRIGWLDEHVRCGLPDAQAVRRVFEEALRAFGRRQRVAVESGVPAWLWTRVWLVLMCGWPGRGNALAQVALRAMTPLLTRARFGAPYRVALYVEPEARGDG